MILQAGARLGPYRVVSAIGHGGVGEVYLAEDPRLQRRVAIKVLNAQHAGDDNARERFLREARMAAALDHPNICTLHEIDTVEDADYIVMQHLDGVTLREWIDRGRTPPADAHGIALQLADALAYAHGRGVIHRDIKPQNVMLLPGGRVKLMDFGLAKTPDRLDDQGQTRAALTEDGRLLGTLAYMAPEQLEGRPADERSDIFALGITLYELFAGVHPFAGATSASTISAILSRPPAPLSRVAPDAPASLSRMLERALAIRPEDRYQSAQDLVHDLRESGAGHPGRPRHAAARRYAGVWIVAAAVALWAVWEFAPRPGHPPPSSPAPALPVASSSLKAWLDVQPVRAGVASSAFQSVGNDVLRNGWKFRVNAVPAAPGSIYIVADEHGLDGKSPVVTLLFPDSNSPSPIAGPLVGEWNVVGGAAADTSLWIVWSRGGVRMLAALTRLVNPVDAGVVRGTADADAVRRQLVSLSAQSTTVIDTSATRVVAHSSGPDVAIRLALRQR